MSFARAKRRDRNEPSVVDALEAAGATVTRIDADGFPDLVVGYRGKTWLLEVKLPLGPRGGKSARRESEGGRGDLTRAQVAWWDSWRGEPAIVVRSPAEALEAVGCVETADSDNASPRPANRLTAGSDLARGVQ